MIKPSKEDMLNCFDGMCLFLANHGWTERDERAVAIRKLIKKKPKATMAFVEKWAYEINDVWAGKIKEEDFVIKLLEEAGVEIVGAKC